MGIARDLVELEVQLRQHAEIDLFSTSEKDSLLSTTEYASMLPLLTTTASTGPASVMRLCMQALRIQYDELRTKLLDAELVATLPPEIPGIARTTESVVHEMMGRAAKEIILLGYEFTNELLVALLADATSRGVDVFMICDRGRGTAQRVIDVWPRRVNRPRVFHDRPRPDGAPYAAMHAKCLLVDDCDLLVTSANFTFHGMRGNIEIGIRLRGPPAAEARKVFSYLVENRVVEEFLQSDPNA